jgi:LmbE family N-acetylglucosaminyl deacetylase
MGISPMRFLLFAATVLFTSLIGAIQPTKTMDAAEIQLALKKMQVLGSVLYVAAHPDDENTALLAYFSNERLLRTAYLAITRGSGGQNLIGTEKGEQLGILRTHELLAARLIDGTEQFFTRAIDFGYSKNAEETLKIWDKQEVLSDMVWVIRQFRPDVIVTRFTPEIGGHGHHRSSAILAEEAFGAAGDPTQFPEQLKFVEPWQAKRLVWNAWSRYFSENDINTSDLISVDLGKYNALLGEAYMEIAAKSRSMHKSQGFGMRGYRGTLPNYFIHTAGDSAKTDLFEDVDVSWNRVEGGQSVSSILEKAYQEFNPEDPSQSLPLLISAYKQINAMPSSFWVDVKKRDLKKIIQACAGIWIEAISDDYSATAGEEIKLTMMVVNRSDFDFRLNKIIKPFGEQDTVYNYQLENNQPIEWNTSLVLPEDMEYTQPYWLRENPEGAMYTIKNQQMIGKPESEPALKASLELSSKDLALQLETPVLFTWTDRVKGELYRPLEIIPKVSVSLLDELYVFPDDNSKQVRVKVTSGVENVSGDVNLIFNDGWKVKPVSLPFSISEKLAETFK